MRTRIRQRQVHRAASRAHPQPHRPVRRQALPGIRRKAVRRLPRRARAAGLRAGLARSACSSSWRTTRRSSSSSTPTTSRRARCAATWASPTTRTCCASSTPSAAWALYVGSVVVTQYAGQPAADAVPAAGSRALGVHVLPRITPSPAIPTTSTRSSATRASARTSTWRPRRPLVVVTAPGPGSAARWPRACRQLYHEHKRGIAAGYAKFETFPIWNLPLKHPVNIAYEAATADLDDVNMIDPFHLEAYGETTVNYNRDVEMFPVLTAMFERISGAMPLPVAHRHGREHGGQLPSSTTRPCREAASRRSCAATSRRAGARCAAPGVGEEHRWRSWSC